MQPQTTTTYTLYYSFLGCLLLTATVLTLGLGARQVTFGKQVAKLQVQQQNLVKHHTQLQLEYSRQVSIASAQNYASAEDFQPIQSPVRLIVADQAAVASR